MDRSERLQLIFAGDEALLKLDTQLNSQEEFTYGPWNEPYSQPTGETTESPVALDQPTLNEPQTIPQKKPSTTPHKARKIPEYQLRNAFCPAKALAKFPYKYIFPKGDELSKTVARQFFDGGKVWNRIWDLYYLPIPIQISEQPLLLVPALQVKELLDEINYNLNCDLALLAKTQDGLVLFFDTVDGTPKPVHLGQIDDRDELNRLEKSIPQPKKSDGDWTKLVEPEALAAWEKKISDSLATYKKRRSWLGKFASPFAEMTRRHPNQTNLARGLYQLKSYFGLRPALHPGTYLAGDKDFAPVQVLEPVPWETQDNPIFYSVDVEWNERNSEQVTEIGISSLDTIDIHGIPPGPHGENWIKHIKSAHLRTAEYRDHCNTEFVIGCPEMFLFGESEIVPNEQIGRRADWFFASPYDGSDDVKQPDLPEHKLEPRCIVLVGHDPDADTRLLAERCSIIDSLKTRPGKLIREVMDTQLLYGHLRKEKNPPGLATMLLGLGIESRCLHNAGNDARYTLEALIRIALESAGEPSSISRVDMKTEQKGVVQEESGRCVDVSGH